MNRAGDNRKTDTAYSDEWYTPPEIVAAFGSFELDPCSAETTFHAPRRFTKEVDGLSQMWVGRVWLNPPFSNLLQWGLRLAEHGDGILLCPGRTDTKWFHALARRAQGLFFKQGRIQVIAGNGQGKANTVGSVFMAFGERNVAALKACALDGFFVAP